MHYHLDLLGGMAGDMFAAAMLDCHPEWREELSRAIAASGLADDLAVSSENFNDGVLSGRRFLVHEPAPAHHHHDDPASGHHHHEQAHGHHAHRHWRQIRHALQYCALSPAVIERATAIFQLLAEAEAEVHGKPVDEVAFHEVGAWDSIADIVSAAWLIERSGADGWSCSTIPMGRGRVSTAHGLLPVPAPATRLLLRGLPVIDDGVDGERVTPTGAAILKYLAPSFGPRDVPMIMLAQGVGFGTKRFAGFSNVVQVSCLQPSGGGGGHERISVCEFEVDDQTAEDLAVALERVRAEPGVLDVVQIPAFGKKGRMVAHVQVLTEAAAAERVVELCLTETTTLGVRWHDVARRVLQRRQRELPVDGAGVRVKRALRPDGRVTRKPDMDDLRGASGGHVGREQRRARASALDEVTELDESTHES